MFSHYLMFNRNCAEALAVYAKAFDGEITAMERYGDMPPNPNFPIPEGDKDLVLHSRLVWNGSELSCADASANAVSGKNMYISVTLADQAAVQKAWDVLKEEGEIYMDLAPSFFAAAHGSLRDRFGINWMFTATK